MKVKFSEIEKRSDTEQLNIAAHYRHVKSPVTRERCDNKAATRVDLDHEFRHPLRYRNAPETSTSNDSTERMSRNFRASDTRNAVPSLLGRYSVMMWRPLDHPIVRSALSFLASRKTSLCLFFSSSNKPPTNLGN
jgi:hypothetical protein